MSNLYSEYKNGFIEVKSLVSNVVKVCQVYFKCITFLMAKWIEVTEDVDTLHTHNGVIFLGLQN